MGGYLKKPKTVLADFCCHFMFSDLHSPLKLSIVLDKLGFPQVLGLSLVHT